MTLMDELDSIHVFLFHAPSSTVNMDPARVVRPVDDDKDKDDEADPDPVWASVPASVSECTLDQIVSIIGEHLFAELKPNIVQILLPHKQGIIEYIKQHQIDGLTLTKKSRKAFAEDIKAHLQVEDSKMRTALAFMYTAITKTHDLKLHKRMADLDDPESGDEGKCTDANDDVWLSVPSSVEQCSGEQIRWILMHCVFDELKQNVRDKLKEHKLPIIGFFKTNSIDGQSLKDINVKELFARMHSHLQLTDNKLKGALVALFRAMKGFDLSCIVADEAPEEQKYDVEAAAVQVALQSNKFVTEVDAKAHSNYSFGVAFNYIQKDHPLFVAPKYRDMRQELNEYDLIVHKESYLRRLETTLFENTAAMGVSLQSTCHKLIKNQLISSEDLPRTDHEAGFALHNVHRLLSDCNQVFNSLFNERELWEWDPTAEFKQQIQLAFRLKHQKLATLSDAAFVAHVAGSSWRYAGMLKHQVLSNAWVRQLKWKWVRLTNNMQLLMFRNQRSNKRPKKIDLRGYRKLRVNEAKTEFTITLSNGQRHSFRISDEDGDQHVGLLVVMC